MHRATLALADACRLAQQLGHQALRVGTDDEGVGVVAVGGDDMVLWAAGGDRADGRRFLTDVEMQEAADFAQLV